MKPSAVILDVYGTLLELRQDPWDIDQHWVSFWGSRLHTYPRLTPAQFTEECDRVIAREHAMARARGIQFPEVYWPHVVVEVLPECARLSDRELCELRFFYKGLPREARLVQGAASALRMFLNAGVVIGLASNCQPYTLGELDLALGTAGLSKQIFEPNLCFLSFEHGFSKPDPYVFHTLRTRLAIRRIRPEETLMIGDSVDCDIEPARAIGWQTWHLTETIEGNWAAFVSWWHKLDQTKP